MNHVINNKTLVTVIASICAGSVHAAAFDRTGQSISAFLQPGNYYEAGLTVTDTSLEGRETGTSKTHNTLADIAYTDYRPATALKLQLSPQVSFGLLYDHPFGSDTAYSGKNSFVATTNDNVIPGVTTTKLAQVTDGKVPIGNSNASFDMQNLSLIVGYQPNKNWNFYLGPSFQTFKSRVELRGDVYSLYNGYTAHTATIGDWGWLAGFAYQIPEKAIKTSLTYRSAIAHEVNATESAPVIDMLSTSQGRDFVDQHLNHLISLGLMTQEKKVALDQAFDKLPSTNNSGTTKFRSPDSVNFDFQTGLRSGTLLFGNARWVHWSGFGYQPYRFGEISKAIGALATPSSPKGFGLVHYFEDQWSGNLGIGQRLSPKLFGSVSVGWDSGAGEKVSTGGPSKGYYNLGLGAQYSPTSQYFISGGVKYFWLGDAKGQLGAQAGSDYYVSEFNNNHSVGYGLKIGYKF